MPGSTARKILIVDDEAHIRALLEQTLEELEDEGVELLSAADGEAALALVAAERPDLVFLDVMPVRRDGRPAHRQRPGRRPRAGARGRR